MKDDPLQQLYGVDLDEFVAERKRLVQSLREEGRPREAEDVAARRKPPLPAFLANRLARSRPRETAELIGAAERLAKAHAGSAGDLRDAQERFRNALRKLVEGLADVANRSVSDAVEQRLIATLRAASVDPDMAALLRRGVLADEVDPAGFDALAGIPLKRRPESAATKPPGDSGRSGRADASRRARRAGLQSELAEATKELRSAERAVSTAERERNRKARRVSDLEERLARSRDGD
jgi:hypothetical protein